MTEGRVSAPMTPEEAEALMDRVTTELMPMLRRAMLGVAAVAALVGASTALLLLSIVAASR